MLYVAYYGLLWYLGLLRKGEDLEPAQTLNPTPQTPRPLSPKPQTPKALSPEP